jgi:hypothetical protein
MIIQAEILAVNRVDDWVDEEASPQEMEMIE